MGSADIEAVPQSRISEDVSSLKVPTKVGREELADIVPPHDEYVDFLLGSAYPTTR